MGRVIAVTNLKGGVGKTTTVVNVSAGLALKGAKVLLIDVDAQGNLGMALGVEPRRTLYEVLIDKAAVEDCITPVRPNLDLLAGDDTLLNVQTAIGDRPDKAYVLERTLRSYVRHYDFVFIDCGGSLTILNINAMMFASDLLIPTAVEHLSIRGLALLFKQIQRLKGKMPATSVIVPTMYDTRRKQSEEILTQLRQTYGSLVVDPIRVNVKLSEAPAVGQTIYEYDPRSRGAIEYAALVEHLGRLWKFPEAKAAPAPATTSPSTLSNPTPIQSSPAELPNSVQANQASVPVQVETGKRPLRRLSIERPMVTGRGATEQYCPDCGHLLQRSTAAGYRISFCNHCKYRRQELINSSRP
jgi:chromosome partitioning protein